MTRAETLRALAERVEVGAPVGLVEWATTFPPEVAYGIEAYHHAYKALGYYDQNGGSVDACAAFAKVVLQGRWRVRELSEAGGPCWCCVLSPMPGTTHGSVMACAPTESRARLSAILRALAAEQEGKSDG